MRGLLALLLWLLVPACVTWAQEPPVDGIDASPTARLVLVGSGFFPQGKLALYRQAAAEAGIMLDYHRAPFADGVPPDALLHMHEADLVLVDVPPVRMYRDDSLVRQLSAVPRLLLVDREGQQARGLDDDSAALLAAYARNGGRRNLAMLMDYLVRWHAGGAPPADPAPALVMPRAGLYHPDYRDLAFERLDEYLDWLGPKVRSGQPVVGIAMFASAIGSDSTAHIDALIRGVERSGGIAVPFFRETDAGIPVDTLLTRDGRAFVDVVVNFEIMYRSVGIADDYARLGVPVLQAITYWDGQEDAWLADRQGISPGATSFYLAIPEQAGFIDPLIVAAAKSRTPPRPIAAQMEALQAKALNLAALRHKPNADKRIAVVFYNYPPGERNLGASGLNLPESLAGTLAALRGAGYRTRDLAASELLPKLQALLAPYYRDGRLDELERDGLVGLLPMREYRQWLQALPDAVQAGIVERWGEPEDAAFVVRCNGEAYFAIPRLALGNVALLPQPSRQAGDASASSAYHDTGTPVDHFYLAAYLYLRQAFGSDAIVHFGTHGTQEWTYGKERGLSVFDNPMLLAGDVPVVYPYIVDDVGEALQARRRGRATVVSHQTPAFGTAGLHGDALRLYQLIEEYGQLDQGAVREQVRAQVLALASEGPLAADLGWTDDRIEADFEAFLSALHEHLDHIAEQAQPKGLHTFGETSDDDRRLETVRLMLGERLDQALGLDAERTTAIDQRELAQEPGLAWLDRHLLQGLPLPGDAGPAQAELLASAHRAYASLDASGETAALLAALDGRHVLPGLGGDPIRTPESLPTGRNLYGFDPMRVPSRAAWDAGQAALAQLVDAYRAQHGQAPEKLAFSLWGVETMRHNGILEAQVFSALGVRPVWDDGGRVDGVELIPAGELGRPRIDVVLSATGLYRDQFPVLMQRINEALALVEAAEDGDNAIARNSAAVRARLRAQGLDDAEADRHARTRIFSSAQGNYGSGLGGRVLRTADWDSDTELAESYLQRMQHAYGPDPAHWGERPAGTNAYAEHLRGTQAAILSRSSNLYGMLTTDDPFSYLGGLSLAVRHLDGKAPELYISNLRSPTRSKVETAARFLATELQTRQFHPGWIRSMQQEGYAGTLEVVASLDNFWGWQAVDPGVVHDGQWQAFHDVYVRDTLQLGTREWFERDNPHALAQIVERMLEAHRKQYWQADEATLRSLVQTWNELESRQDVLPGSDRLRQHVARLAAGFGLAAPTSAAPRSPAAPAPAPPEPRPVQPAESPEAAPAPADTIVSGMRLRQVEPSPPPAPRQWWWLLPAVLAFASGAVVQASPRPAIPVSVSARRMDLP